MLSYKSSTAESQRIINNINKSKKQVNQNKYITGEDIFYITLAGIVFNAVIVLIFI
jgi:hypothetical protein